jgi:flagellar protein FliO/FliZ
MTAGRFQAVWLVSLFPFTAFAAESAVPSTVGAMFQVFLALGLVVLAILGAGWLLRRFGPAQMAQGGALRVLGGVMVGPRERLVLVEVGDTWLIVGVAQGHVSAVHSLPRPANAEAMGQAAADHPAFGAWLKDAWSKRQGGSS